MELARVGTHTSRSPEQRQLPCVVKLPRVAVRRPQSVRGLGRLELRQFLLEQDGRAKFAETLRRSVSGRQSSPPAVTLDRVFDASVNLVDCKMLRRDGRLGV